MLELYHTNFSVCSVKVRLVLAEKCIDWTSHIVNLRAEEQKRPEFLALNPNGLVPVLVHDGVVIPESNIILEYLEDAFPSTVRLMPRPPVNRAKVRGWMQRLDTGLHSHIAQISIGISLSHKFLRDNDTPEKQKVYFDGIKDPVIRRVYEESGSQGVNGPAFVAAIQAWREALVHINGAVAASGYLVNDAPGFADFALLPYVCRLEHLQLEEMWRGLPNVAPWLERMKRTAGYKDGFESWASPEGLAVFKETGEKARGAVANILASS